jgi:hypothetical protein
MATTNLMFSWENEFLESPSPREPRTAQEPLQWS